MDSSDFVLGSLASTGATLFTNPIETRIQLQGELAARGTYVEPYKGILHAFVTVVRNDGWIGLQKDEASTIRPLIKVGEISFGLGLFWGAAVLVNF